MNINDIFTVEQYDEAYQFVSNHTNTTIKDLGNEQYQIIDISLTPEEIEQQEKERIAKLYLTAADVERGIYKAKQMDFDDIIALVIEQQPKGLDIKALKIELKANNFYRGNPYVSIIGKLLGFTEKQLDLFFETNDYTKLLEGDK